MSMLRRDHHKKTRMRAAQWLCCGLSGLMLLEVGCMSGASTRKTSSVKSAENVKSSAPELSSRNQSLLALYSAEIEVAADKIILESPSPAARRQSLMWKAEAIPVMQTSLLNTDPVAAVLDTWAFIFQMTAYMERPALKQILGEFYPVVAETLRKMDAEMERIILLGAPTANVADLRRRVGAWADAHPIQASLAGRQSADPDVIRKVEQSDLGTMTSIKVLAESLGDVTARLDSYNAYLPKQARWQAELLLSDLTRDPQVSATLSNFEVLSNTAAKASSSLDRMPELVGQAREAVRTDVEGQRLSVQAFLREERLQTLDALHHERIATVDAMRGERLAATADVRVERQAVLEALRDQEAAVMNEFKATSDKAIQDLDARGRGLIDHFFLRALELMLLTLVLCSLMAWTLLRRFAAKPPDRANRLSDHAA
jgi:hypothetical protein